MAPKARVLDSPPTDGVTQLCYLPNSKLLASTSWDGVLRIHDTTIIKANDGDMSSSSLAVSQKMESGPLLSLGVSPSEKERVVFTGGLDGTIRQFNIEQNEMSIIGSHSTQTNNENDAGSKEVSGKDAVSCLNVINETIVASASWNCKFYLWDVLNKKCLQEIDLPGKAYAMDYCQNKIVISTSNRKNCFIDLTFDDENGTRKATLTQNRESSLKYQTRCIRFFPDATGFAMGSIEGRVAVEYIGETQKKKYAFKCHRVNDHVYPVNAIAFHPQYTKSFATGGCDGTVVIWDSFHKKRLRDIGNYSNSIAALVFSEDGTEIAIAASYTFEEGQREHHPKDEIYVRPIQETDVKPKSSSSSKS